MTLRDWAILLQVARGEVVASAQEVAGLIEQGVVEWQNGGIILSQQGRTALGLPLHHSATPAYVSYNQGAPATSIVSPFTESPQSA